MNQFPNPDLIRKAVAKLQKPQPVPSVEYYSPAQLATKFAIPVRTVREAIKRGELRCNIYNRRVWRIASADAGEWHARTGTDTKRTTTPYTNNP